MTAKLDVEYLELKNFLSYGNYVTRLRVKGPKGGLGPVLVLGENDESESDSSNGSGKSSLLTAFIWCLFGRTITNPNPGDKVVNWHVGSGCFVKIKTTDGWEIIRTRKIDGHAELILKKDGCVEETHSTSTNTQKELNRIFGLDYEIFVSSVFCGQFSKSFLEMSPVKRKEALERILGLHKLNDYADFAKKKFKNVEEEQNVLRTRIQLLTSDIARQEERMLDSREKERTFELEKENRIDRLAYAIEDVDNDIKEIDLPNLDVLAHKWETVEIINAKLNGYKESIRVNEFEIASLKRNLDRLSKELLQSESYQALDTIELKKQYFDLKERTSEKKKVDDAISEQTQIIVGYNQREKDLSLSIEGWRNKALTKCVSCEQIVDAQHAHKHAEIVKKLLSCVIEEREKERNKSAILKTECDRIGEIPFPEYSLYQIEKIEKHNVQVKERIIEINDEIGAVRGTISSLRKESGKSKTIVDRVEKQLAGILPVLTVAKAEEIHATWRELSRNRKHLIGTKEELAGAENPYNNLCAGLYETIEEIANDVSSNESTIEQLDVMFSHYNYVYRSYSDRRKIKKWLLSELIPFLNDRIQYYLGSFDLDINISFSSTLSSETDKWGYEFCSGGERKRIDLAIMFALYDLYMSIYGQQCNLMILDEVDGRLDKKGVEAFAEIVNDFSADSSIRPSPDTILVISHKSELKDVFQSQIMVKKRGNFSTIEQ